MSGEEAGAIISSGAQITVAVINGAVQLVAPIVKLTAGGFAAILKGVATLSGNGIAKAYDTARNHGHMSAKRLHRIEGGDLHNVVVSKDDLAQIKKQLKKLGVNFNISQGKDGTQFVSFAGKDINTVELAVRKVLGATLDDLAIRTAISDSIKPQPPKVDSDIPAPKQSQEPTFASFTRDSDGQFVPTTITRDQAQQQLDYMKEHLDNPNLSPVTKERWADMVDDWKGKDSTLDPQIAEVTPRLEQSIPDSPTVDELPAHTPDSPTQASPTPKTPESPTPPSDQAQTQSGQPSQVEQTAGGVKEKLSPRERVTQALRTKLRETINAKPKTPTVQPVQQHTKGPKL